MADLNQVAMSGNLTRDPELRQAGGKSVTTLRIASNNYKGEAGYFDWTAWEKTADIAAKFLRKGSKVTLAGQAVHREFTDKDGNKRSVVEFVARELILPPKGNGNGSSSDEEIPF